jgi:Mg2+ and Co2+ transporter CorA
MTKVHHLADEARTPLPDSPLFAPSYGAPQRDAINSVIDGIVSDLCKDIGELRRTLDDIEQQVLEGAAKAKEHLTDQVRVCVSVKDEISHMKRVVADIKERGEAML